MEERKAKLDGKWIRINVSCVEDILRKVWNATRERDLGLAIILAESYGDEAFKEDVRFLKRLIQLEASGYVVPPIQFAELYMKVRVSK